MPIHSTNGPPASARSSCRTGISTNTSSVATATSPRASQPRSSRPILVSSPQSSTSSELHDGSGAIRPPLPASLLRDHAAAALDYEIAQEKASTLGRLGRALEAALAELTAFDAAHSHDSAEAERTARAALVAAAGLALWHFVVQRE